MDTSLNFAGASILFPLGFFRVNPKFCVNSKWGANRAKLIQGGSRVNPAAALFAS